jgi:hypothetical protein
MSTLTGWFAIVVGDPGVGLRVMNAACAWETMALAAIAIAAKAPNFQLLRFMFRSPVRR